MTVTEIQNKVNAEREAYQTVINELRAMGMDDLFIMEFLDKGQADGIITEVTRRNRKTETRR